MLRHSRGEVVERAEAEAEVVRVGPNRPLFALTGVLSACMAGSALLLLAMVFWSSGPWLEKALYAPYLLGSVFLYGACARFLLGALLPGGTVVTLDANGVRDRSSWCVADVIRWDEIESVSLRGWGPFKVLSVRVRHLDALLARQRPFARLLLRTNLRTGGTPLGIYQTSVGVPLGRLRDQIEARLTRHRNERRWWTQR